MGSFLPEAPQRQFGSSKQVTPGAPPQTFSGKEGQGGPGVTSLFEPTISQQSVLGRFQ